MPSNSQFICIPCRQVFRQTDKCPNCGGAMALRHHKWRAPRKTNRKAWKLIEQGDWLWDKRAVAEKEQRERHRNFEWRQRLKSLMRANKSDG
jgi:hypothetical protein